jgi:biopolymer transport protein ExbD
MNFRRSGRKPRFGFDTTPMIDVVLQLIIFFMYTSQFSRMVRTPVDLPSEPGEKQRAEAHPPLSLDVNRDGRYLVDGREVPLEEFARMIQVEIHNAGDPASLELLVRADRSAPALAINRLAERLALLGVRTWQLATSDPGRARQE